MNQFEHPKPKPTDTCLEMVVERHSIHVAQTGDAPHRRLVILSGRGEHHTDVALSIVNADGFSLADTEDLLIQVPESYWRDMSRLLDKLDGTQLIELQVHYNFAEKSVSYFSIRWPVPELVPQDALAKLRGGKGAPG